MIMFKISFQGFVKLEISHPALPPPNPAFGVEGDLLQGSERGEIYQKNIVEGKRNSKRTGDSVIHSTCNGGGGGGVDVQIANVCPVQM